MTKDGGQNWKNVTPKGLEPGGRVDCVEPSPHSPAKAYISVLRYQLGDWKPYIYRTKDYGKSWTLISTGKNGIPADYPTRVVREDPDREGLLYAGTEFGLFISFNDGETWEAFQQNMPVTPITDLKIHRQDLVLSTMGRGFWILDNIKTLHQLNQDAYAKTTQLFQPKNTYRYRYAFFRGIAAMEGAPTYPAPSVLIDYYLAEDQQAPIRLEIVDASGKAVRSYISMAKNSNKSEEGTRDMATNEISYSVNANLSAKKGMHRFRWDMRHTGAWNAMEMQRFRNGPYALPGTYTAKLTVGDQSYEQSFELLLDPRAEESGVTTADLKQQIEISLKVVDLLSDARRLLEEVKKTKTSLGKKTESASKERLAELESLEQKLETAEGRYQTPMLIDQIRYLYGITRQADQRPGQDVYTRYDELLNLLQEYKQIVDAD